MCFCFFETDVARESAITIGYQGHFISRDVDDDGKIALEWAKIYRVLEADGASDRNTVITARVERIVWRKLVRQVSTLVIIDLESTDFKIVLHGLTS